jgi:Ni/Co efflux regulator RcnB
MRKTILTILASTLLAATTVQIAAAAEHYRGHKADRAPAAASEQIRNSNAYALPSPAAEPGWSRYESGALSAPAGR